jgi:hypothetical protein
LATGIAASSQFKWVSASAAGVHVHRETSIMVLYIKSTSQLTLLSMLLTSILLVACASGDGGQPSITGTKTTSLAQLHWCGGKPLMVFHDEGASTTATAGSPEATRTQTTARATPTTLTNWDIVKASLDFTVYLPTSLPDGSCLMSVSGTLHDPIFGSSFTIGYLLPTDDSINLSEAPVHMQNPTFQCNISSASNTVSKVVPANSVSSTTAAAKESIQICTGVQKGTSIVLAARGTTNDLKTFFQNLQPNIDWEPAS